MKSCPYCQETTRQIRAGKTQAGSQWYRYNHCGHKYTPEQKKQGYPGSVRKRAMEMYMHGNNLWRIARHLKVAPQTVAYWVTEVAEASPREPLPEAIREAELDELFTFLGEQKTKSTF